VFLELPKYDGGPHPRTVLDKWAYFFREAEDLDVVPPELDEAPFREALEVARMAGMSEAEYEAYERAKMAEQDARGALQKAEERGLAEGRRAELRRSLADLCELLEIEMTDDRRTLLALADLPRLETLRDRIKQERRWPVS
jgi:flagellar biosynthesis/type III secretory pathway protein FliH